MTLQNVSDISASVKVTPTAPKTDKKQDNSKEEFMSLMAGSMNNVPVAGGNSAISGQRTDLSEITTVKIETFDSKDDASFNSSYKINKVDDASYSEKDVAKLKEDLDSYGEKIKDIITQEMDVTEEELEDAMEVLGLSFLDLSDPANLSALLSQFSEGEDKVSLLLDGSVQDIFSQINDLSESLLVGGEVDIQDMKQLMEEPVILEQMPLPQEQQVDVAPETAVEIPIEVKQESEPNVSNKSEDIAPQVRRAEDTPDRPLDIETKEPEDEAAVALKDITVSTARENAGQGGTQSQSFGQPQSGQNTAAQSQMATPEHITENNMTAQTPTFDNSINQVETQPEVPVYSGVNPADIIEQVVSQARVTITQQIRSMELELNPQNLGKMIMQVSENEGQITARFITQTEAVREAMESAIANLMDRLNEQGIKVDAVEVSVGTHEFEENLEEQFANQAREDLNDSRDEGRSNQSRTGGINLASGEGLSEQDMTEEEILTASMMRTYGNTVNFRA